MDDYQNSFLTPGGRQFAQEQIQTLRQHMAVTAIGDASKMAADALQANVGKMADAWSVAARNDPSSVDYLIDQARHTVDATVGSSPALTPADAAQARTELTDKMIRQIVRAGGLGVTESSSNPEAASQAYATRYAQYIDPVEIDQFVKNARFYSNLDRSQARAAREDQDYAARRQFNMSLNQLESESMPQNAGDAPQVPQNGYDRLRQLIRDNPNGAAQEAGRVRTTVDNWEAITKRLNSPEVLASVSHQTTVQRFNDLRAPDADLTAITRKINEDYGNSLLTNGDRSYLLKEVDNLRTPGGQHLNDMKRLLTEAVKPSIIGFLSVKDDPEAAEHMYQWEFELNRRISDLQREGQDPFVVFDPSKPEYMGSSKALEQILGSPQKQLQRAIELNGGVGAPLPVYMAPGKAAQLPTITDKAAYDKLAPGAAFLDQHGKRWTKPQSEAPSLQPGQM